MVLPDSRNAVSGDNSDLSVTGSDNFNKSDTNTVYNSSDLITSESSHNYNKSDTSSVYSSDLITGESRLNYNISANDHINKSDRSGRKLTTLLREDISNEIEEEEKSLEEEKRAVIQACRYSPSSLCQLVRKLTNLVYLFATSTKFKIVFELSDISYRINLESEMPWVSEVRLASFC